VEVISYCHTQDDHIADPFNSWKWRRCGFPLSEDDHFARFRPTGVVVLMCRLSLAAQFATRFSSISIVSLLDATVIKYVSYAYVANLLARSTVLRSFWS